MRNVMHNAETHGGQSGKGTIKLLVNASNPTSDCARLCIQIINSAGAGHTRSLELQRSLGPNFLLTNACAPELVGSQDSTFLGMREIASAAQVLSADVSVMFMESDVYTSVIFTVKVLIVQPAPA